ncbi:MAG: hypothetical protein IPI30_04265 [Saprospiraceae bacterium]|nr:hypothetical protein [Candidatus Vicinibacter affinis]
MEFVASDVLMLKNDWKFRYSNGWKINLDTEFDLGGGKKVLRQILTLEERSTI